MDVSKIISLGVQKKVKQAPLLNAIKDMDANKDGVISVKEYRDGINNMASAIAKGSMKKFETEINQVFDIVDRNQDKMITIDEIKEAIKNQYDINIDENKDLSMEQLAKLIKNNPNNKQA